MQTIQKGVIFNKQKQEKMKMRNRKNGKEKRKFPGK